MFLWSVTTAILGGGTVFTRSNKFAIAFAVWAVISLALFATGNPQAVPHD